MSTATQPHPVVCETCGPMAYADGAYHCQCLTIPAADFEPYFALTDDPIRLTPPAASKE